MIYYSLTYFEGFVPKPKQTSLPYWVQWVYKNDLLMADESDGLICQYCMGTIQLRPSVNLIFINNNSISLNSQPIILLQ